jgi:hypothetical protein
MRLFEIKVKFLGLILCQLDSPNAQTSFYTLRIESKKLFLG